AMRGAGTIQISCGRPRSRSRPAPTTSPRICARPAATAGMTTSNGSLRICPCPSTWRWQQRLRCLRLRLRPSRTPPVSCRRSAPNAPREAASRPLATHTTATEWRVAAYGQANLLAPYVPKLGDAGIQVSLFIAPELREIEAAARIGAAAIEIHVGPWCDALAEGRTREADAEWRRIVAGASAAHELGLEVHAGHGLDYST